MTDEITELLADAKRQVQAARDELSRAIEKLVQVEVASIRKDDALEAAYCEGWREGYSAGDKHGVIDPRSDWLDSEARRG